MISTRRPPPSLEKLGYAVGQPLKADDNRVKAHQRELEKASAKPVSSKPNELDFNNPRGREAARVVGKELTPFTGLPSQPIGGLPGAFTAALDAPSLDAAFDALPATGRGDARVALLADNPTSWACRYDAMAGATKAIDSAYFIFDRDIFGLAYLGTLIEKARQGVKVRLLLDDVGGGTRGMTHAFAGKDYLQELAAAGGEAKVYNPVRTRFAKLGSMEAVAVNHDKITAIDGRFGITGGQNISAHYFESVEDTREVWRDKSLSVEGEGAVAGLTVSFEREWNQRTVTSKVKPDALGNWDSKLPEIMAAKVMMDHCLAMPALADADKRQLREDPAARAALAARLAAAAEAKLPALGVDGPLRPNDRERILALAGEFAANPELFGASSRVERRNPAHTAPTLVLDQTSRAGDPQINDIAPALLTLVEKATGSIVIQNPYVVLTEQMVKALERAGKRGVQVSILTNSPLSTDSALTQAWFKRDWQYILARVPNSRIFVSTDQKIHAKCAVLDEKVSFVSTYNVDQMSGVHNGEEGVAVKSGGFARDLLSQIYADQRDQHLDTVEYRIARDAAGNALLEDGKPVPLFGPEDHCPPEVIGSLSARVLGPLSDWLRVVAFDELQHPPLTGKDG